jgi:glucose-1-phosphate thymidylyltransferase
MEIAKALVLAGRTPGDVPWPSIAPLPKSLAPVANRPILVHSLETLRSAGVLEVAIAVAPDAAPAMRRAIGDGTQWGLSVSISEHGPRDGIAAILAANAAFLRDEPVLVQQADALLRERIHRHIAAFATEDLDALVLRLPSSPAGTSAAATQATAAAWLLSSRAVRMLADGRETEAGLDPTEWVRGRGRGVATVEVDGCLMRRGQADLLEGNRRMLEELSTSYDEGSLLASELQGKVVVHPTARLERTLVRGPAIIGPGACLTDAYVGPYTSIGPGVVIEGAEVEHSIILSGAEVRFAGTRIASSVIGERARVARTFALPTATRLSVGAGAEIVLG